MTNYETLIYKIMLKIFNHKAIILIDDSGKCHFYNTNKLIQECQQVSVPNMEWMNTPDNRENAWWCKE